jgi:hypothetical protein
MNRLLSSALLSAALAVPAAAAPELAQVHVLAIRPTQIAVGMIEVQTRADHLRSMGDHELKKYLNDRPIPVVAGPGGELYMVDHHHLARAAWEAGIHKVPIEQKADYSHMTPEQFWAKMHADSLVYPYDQYGAGPHPVGTLPSDVRGLADDPYRSLAWRVRDQKGYDKTDKPFAEFKWAEFFRKNLPLPNMNDHFDQAVEQALELARTPAAASLPGYKPK